MEELAVELRKGIEVATGDLEPHDGGTHLCSSSISLSLLLGLCASSFARTECGEAATTPCRGFQGE
jgi:hypothetical protein